MGSLWVPMGLTYGAGCGERMGLRCGPIVFIWVWGTAVWDLCGNQWGWLWVLIRGDLWDCGEGPTGFLGLWDCGVGLMGVRSVGILKEWTSVLCFMLCLPSPSRKNDCHTDQAVTSIQNHRNQKTHIENESKRTLAFWALGCTRQTHDMNSRVRYCCISSIII